MPAVVREPLWRDVVGEVLRRERLAQARTLKDVADAARISMPYLSEVERGRKEASSEVLAAAARSLGLGLAELLALAQDELVRLAEVRARRMRGTGAIQRAVHGSVVGGSAEAGVGGAGGASLGSSASGGVDATRAVVSRRTEMCLAA